MKNNPATVSNTTSIATLDSLLQGERSAVATYEQAQRHLKGEYADTIEENRSCHAKRVEVIARRITELGGRPSTTGGVWVGFTKAVENTASVLGTGAVIAALEQGEDIGVKDYRDALDKLDATSRTLVTQDLQLAQDRTHRRMSDIKHSRR